MASTVTTDSSSELVYEVRRSQTATDRYDQAVADAIGLNRTDMRCLDVIQREGPCPPGGSPMRRA